MPTKKPTESSVKTTAEQAEQTKGESSHPKAMDIHPAGTAPTVTVGRPVIIGNKSMAGDPMLSVNKPQPTSNTNANASGDATTAPVISHHVKTVSPIANSRGDEPLDQENDAVAKSVEPLTVEKSKASDDTSEKSSKESTTDNTQTDEKLAEEANKNPKVDEGGTLSKPATYSPVEESIKDDSDDGAVPSAEEEAAPQEKTAEQVREEQIEALIQKKTYAVPIDKTGRRRHNAVLALLLTVVLAVIAVNFLLDFGVITIPGAPSTNLF